MSDDDNNKEPKDLATYAFRQPFFQFAWSALIFGVMVTIFEPVQHFALVCCVYGIDGYFQKGIRVMPGKKPLKFSNGITVPTLPDMITGFGIFIITAASLTLLLIFVLRFYERHFMKGKTDDEFPSDS